MTYVPRSSLLGMKSLVSLAGPLQGTLRRSSDGKGAPLSQFTTSDGTGFDALLKEGQAREETFCVRKLRVLDPANLTVQSGPQVEGPFTLRGARVALPGSPQVFVATVLAISGSESLPPNLRSPSGTYLVSFDAIDVARCKGASPLIPFGTQTAIMPLAPILSYCRPLLQGTLERLLVACVNGLFVMRRIGAPKEGVDAARTVDNLVKEIAIVVDAEDKTAARNTIFRLGKTGIIVASDLELVHKVQRQLGVPTSPSRTLPPLATATHLVCTDVPLPPSSDELPEVQSLDAALSAARMFFPSATAHEQPLSRWQGPHVTLDMRVSIGTEGQEQQEQGHQTFLVREGRLGVDMAVSSTALREPRPGESPETLKEQLMRALVGATRGALQDATVEKQSQLDSLTQSLSSSFQSLVAQSGLFESPVPVEVQLSQRVSKGTLVTGPAGNHISVPLYSLSASSPRLQVYLGGLVALGIGSTYMTWDLTIHNGIYIKDI